MAEVEITQELIQRAAQHPGVREHLQVVANRIKARAESIAENEGVDMEVTTVAGTRPLGRPYVNVVTDAVDQEFGTELHARHRIIGRAGADG